MMPIWTLAILLIGVAPEPIDTVVVCPREFVAALDPLLAHRYAQGHRFAYVANTGSAAEIRTAVRRVAATSLEQGGKLRYVLLVGDAEPGSGTNIELRRRCVPTYHVDAKVNVKFGSEPTIPSDNWFADLDDDSIPDLAIGRLPADTPAELTQMVAKILAYEQAADHGLWRQRINLVAGVGGFSPLADNVIEMAARKFITEGIPPTYTTSMTYASWRSPYFPDPRLFHQTVAERHNEGCLFWVYLGHGHYTSLDRITLPGGRYHILGIDDCDQLKCDNGSPIAVMLACYTAAFDQQKDCLAEAMVKSAGGPVAVYGGSRVTMPYAMAVMGNEMLRSYFRDEPPTLGDVILLAKQRMMHEPDIGSETDRAEETNRLLLDNLAAVLSPTSKVLKAERREHLHLFTLLGDPMTKFAYPGDVSLAPIAEAKAGQVIEIQGKTDIAGPAIVELVCRRDKLRFVAPKRDRFDPSHEGLLSFQGVYEEANNRCWTFRQLQLSAGEFRTSLEIPEGCEGPCHVRVFVAAADRHALGHTQVLVRKETAAEGLEVELPTVQQATATK